MRTTFIYFLQDPENPTKGYVGKSNNPGKRLCGHLNECRTQTHYRANWINELATRGLKPAFEVIDEVPFEHWPQIEVAYIEFFLEQGYELTNATPGGEDPPSWLGGKHTPEVCARISAARKGKKLSTGHRKKLSDAKKGRTRSLQSCLNQSASTKGVPKPPGFGAKQSAAQKGKTVSAAARANMREARLLWLKNNRPQEILA